MTTDNTRALLIPTAFAAVEIDRLRAEVGHAAASCGNWKENDMRCDIFKVTTDDWYPAFKLADWYKGTKPNETMLVQVSFTQTGPNPPINGEWRVCVWGGDDCGMERDFTNEKEAWCCFLEVIGLDDVNMAALKKRGFTYA